MPETTNDIIAENTEQVMKEVWGAEEATATVERDLGDDQFQLYVSYEGELEQTDKRFVFKDSAGYQAIGLFDHKGQNTIEAIYMFVTEENAPAGLVKELDEKVGEGPTVLNDDE